MTSHSLKTTNHDKSLPHIHSTNHDKSFLHNH